MIQEEKIKEVKDFLEGGEQILKKKVKIIFDGKQYNIRIPLDFAKKSLIDTEKDVFEFTLEIPKDKSKLPSLLGKLVEENEEKIST